jgi:hypothetical protein
MCENTLEALQEVIDAMEQKQDKFTKDMNEHEKRALRGLIEACKDFLEIADDDGYEDF